MRKSVIAVLIEITVIIISNITGHYNPPFSITVTAILPLILVGAVNRPLYNINFLAAIIYGYGLIIFNDILIRMYAGGTHDQVGATLITLFSLVAFGLSSACMLVYAYNVTDRHSEKSLNKQRIQNLFKVFLCGMFTLALYITFLAEK